ncbi:MAG TPA: TetR-like C-terminal domain-containing protein [Bradyrhizobium sp.]|nr:TetR-like C-terminal domain-containing protein [Bradyrhizobium sp.]
MKPVILGTALWLLAPAAQAGDQGDPEVSCQGNTFEMVECLKAKTAQWDKRFGIAYQQAMKEAQPAQREPLRAAERLSQDNAEIIDMAGQALADAFAQGQLRIADLKTVQIAGRAMVYGFARMNIDGHFPRWGVAEVEAGRTAEAIVDLFIEGIAKRRGG